MINRKNGTGSMKQASWIGLRPPAPTTQPKKDSPRTVPADGVASSPTAPAGSGEQAKWPLTVDRSRLKYGVSLAVKCAGWETLRRLKATAERAV